MTNCFFNTPPNQNNAIGEGSSTFLHKFGSIYKENHKRIVRTKISYCISNNQGTFPGDMVPQH